jgi:hypothetical protein
MTAERSSSVCYSLTKIDDRGRVADRSFIRVLLWGPGHPIDLTALQGPAVLVASSTEGQQLINRQGHLRLPASVRRLCGLEPGDRLLMAADRERQIVEAQWLRWTQSFSPGTAADNPATKVAKPRRLASTRHALAEA